MKTLRSRCRNAFRPATAIKLLVWVLVSLILTQFAHGLSGYALYLGGTGWFLAIPADLVFLGLLLLSSLAYLLHFWVSVFSPALYTLTLTLQNTQVSSSSIYYSFSPFSEGTIRQLAEQLCEEDCRRWSKEALWEEVEDGWSIAYLPSTAEVRITPAAFYLAALRQMVRNRP